MGQAVVPSVDNMTRLSNYIDKNGSMRLKPGQRRRIKHKDEGHGTPDRPGNRKTHRHVPGERCARCWPEPKPRLKLGSQPVWRGR